MTAFELLRDLLALIGILCLLMRLFGRKNLERVAGEDGPIRVKGGSVIVESDDFNWAADGDEGETDYTYKGSFKQWDVKAWDSEADWKNWKKDPKQYPPAFTATGRRVVVVVGPSSAEARVVFRANGFPRLKARQGQFLIDGRKLKDEGDASHWPRHVFVRDNGSPAGDHPFPNRDGVIELRPAR